MVDKERKSEAVVKRGTKILLGQPVNYPDDMVNALKEFFRKHKEVESAYLFLALREGEDNPNLLFDIELSGDKALLFPDIAAVAQKYLSQDEHIDLISAESALGKDAAKESTPFYKREAVQ